MRSFQQAPGAPRGTPTQIPRVKVLISLSHLLAWLEQGLCASNGIQCRFMSLKSTFVRKAFHGDISAALGVTWVYKRALLDFIYVWMSCLVESLCVILYTELVRDCTGTQFAIRLMIWFRELDSIPKSDLKFVCRMLFMQQRPRKLLNHLRDIISSLHSYLVLILPACNNFWACDPWDSHGSVLQGAE